jgi:hypothetical protein
MRTKVCIYPVFEECGKYTLDPFWKEKFRELSNNIFPKGLRYDASANKFTIDIGKKVKHIKLPDKTPELFKKIVEILKTEFGVLSSREVNARQGKENLKKKEEELDCKFKDIKPRHVKDQLIMNFLSELKKRYKLNAREFSDLIATIQIGFQFKSLNNNDVDYRDGEIKNIKRLTFVESTRKFKTPEIVAPTSRSEKTQNSDKFSSLVKKYIKDNDARIAKFVGS